MPAKLKLSLRDSTKAERNQGGDFPASWSYTLKMPDGWDASNATLMRLEGSLPSDTHILPGFLDVRDRGYSRAIVISSRKLKREELTITAPEGVELEYRIQFQNMTKGTYATKH